jgi:hypothetical protein
MDYVYVAIEVDDSGEHVWGVFDDEALAITALQRYSLRARLDGKANAQVSFVIAPPRMTWVWTVVKDGRQWGYVIRQQLQSKAAEEWANLCSAAAESA